MDTSIQANLTSLFPILGMCCKFIFTMYLYKKNPLLKSNGEDPDQMPQNAAVDWGLHCLSRLDTNGLNVIK